MLAVEQGEERSRLRRRLEWREGASCAPRLLDAGERTDSARSRNRPRLPQPRLRQPRAPAVGHAAREHAARQLAERNRASDAHLQARTSTRPSPRLSSVCIGRHARATRREAGSGCSKSRSYGGPVMLTQQAVGVVSATTCNARECTRAGLRHGLQNLCRHQLTHRVAASVQRTASVRKASCDDGAGARGPGTNGANALPYVATAVAKGAA